MVWYNNLGYTENPFSIKPNQKYNLFFDNKNLKEDIINNIQNNKNVVLRGIFGTGKTSILKKIIKEYGGKNKIYYFNAYSKSSPINYDKVLRNAGGFFSKLFKIKSKDVILFIDEAHHLTDENLEQLNNYSEFKSTVLVSSNKDYKVPNKLSNKFKLTINLGSFTDFDALNIVKDRLGEEQDLLDDGEILSVYKKSVTPREFLLNLDSYCKNKFK
jgi:replication-associated recombination protein RarA